MKKHFQFLFTALVMLVAIYIAADRFTKKTIRRMAWMNEAKDNFLKAPEIP